jgi:hypothetical protein
VSNLRSESLASTCPLDWTTEAFGASEVLATLHCVFSEPRTSEVEDPSSTCLRRWMVQMNFWASGLREFFTQHCLLPPGERDRRIWGSSDTCPLLGSMDMNCLYVTESCDLGLTFGCLSHFARSIMDREDQRPRVIVETQLSHALISFPISAMRRCLSVVGSISTVDLLI